MASRTVQFARTHTRTALASSVSVHKHVEFVKVLQADVGIAETMHFNCGG